MTRLGFRERGMSEMSGSYNAVTWLLDRNVEEGRADKLAFTDTVSELTYGDLQQQSCRVANCCAVSAFAAKSGWR